MYFPQLSTGNYLQILVMQLDKIFLLHPSLCNNTVALIWSPFFPSWIVGLESLPIVLPPMSTYS